MSSSENVSNVNSRQMRHPAAYEPNQIQRTLLDMARVPLWGHRLKVAVEDGWGTGKSTALAMVAAQLCEGAAQLCEGAASPTRILMGFDTTRRMAHARDGDTGRILVGRGFDRSPASAKPSDPLWTRGGHRIHANGFICHRRSPEDVLANLGHFDAILLDNCHAWLNAELASVFLGRVHRGGKLIMVGLHGGAEDGRQGWADAVGRGIDATIIRRHTPLDAPHEIVSGGC